MEARELRIGNWVNTMKGHRQCIDVMCDCVNFEDIERDIFDNIDPIPLTEEWLVRFGIHIDGQSISLKSGTIGVIQRGREGMFKYYLQSPFGMVHLDSIKYVHQLQNLYFSLTGEELELKE